MKKAEMEAHRCAYIARLDEACVAERELRFADAIEAARASWNNIVGMMRLEGKYTEREFSTIESIDIVLRLAPPRMDAASLTELESLLRSQRKIEKGTTQDLGVKLQKARALLADAHHAWNLIEARSDVTTHDLNSALAGGKSAGKTLVRLWTEMRLVFVRQVDGREVLEFVTRMSAETLAKCSGCGAVVRGRKSLFLTPQECPKCRRTTNFVLLMKDASAERKV